MPARLRVVHADITRLPVDAIVNAANASLLGGGGGARSAAAIGFDPGGYFLLFLGRGFRGLSEACRA